MGADRHVKVDLCFSSKKISLHNIFSMLYVRSSIAAAAWLASAPSSHGASYFSVGVGLLDGIANVVESAGLSASAVSLSGTVRRLAAAGGGEALAELRAVLTAQIAPGAALLGAAAGTETAPAVCVFSNSSK